MSRSESFNKSRPWNLMLPEMPRRRGGKEPEDRKRRRGFAGAGFADQRHAFAFGDVEGDAVDGERFAAS